MKSVTPAHERRLTPMLRQYLDAKAESPDAILLFRMGDFYELFFEDAQLAARELDLTLTARDKGADPIPMAGVPHHAVEGYIARLVARGYSVAICDQVEDPRVAKGLVRRAITRLITPGTVSELNSLDPVAPNYLACIQPAATGDRWHLALLDLLAGEVLLTQVDPSLAADELRRMRVREVLAPESLHPALQQAGGAPWVLRRSEALAAPAEPDAEAQRLAGGEAAARTLAQLLAYATATQRRPLVHLQAPKLYRVDDAVVMDAATRANLELTETQMEGKRRHSLLWHLDRCGTSMGSRLLAQWLLFPLRQRRRIEARLAAVASLLADRPRRAALQAALGDISDMERLAGRVALGRANPRDLAALAASLLAAAGAAAAATPAADGPPAAADPLLADWRAADLVEDLADRLRRALVDAPPVSVLEGGIFRSGYCPELDALLAVSERGHGFLAELEVRERARTQIGSLKVRYNRVFGYYLEVTRANLSQVPADYVRKQTLANAERYVTPELKEYEEQLLTAEAQRSTHEEGLWQQLLAAVLAAVPRLRALARLVARTDVLASLAQVADEGRYCRPELVEEPILVLEAARHPVVERLLPGGERFVANDMELDAASRQLLIVTGPNMAGKSTAMRQTALCALLAHMGSFVPATRARIGLCDRIFTRVGASDNLAAGHSTFMVEMLETAAILRYASCRSLVILDEIGRGTSTFDGLSIAWAVAEYLHDQVGCRALFATHYHELCALAASRPRVDNISMAVQEQQGAVVFLRQLVAGPANRSYGIQVARLAGLPERVLARASDLLSELEAPAGPPEQVANGRRRAGGPLTRGAGLSNGAAAARSADEAGALAGRQLPLFDA